MKEKEDNMSVFPSIQPIRGIREVFQYPGDEPKQKAVFAVAQAVLRSPSPLSVSDREMIAAFTSSLNTCQFCQGSHTTFALRAGAQPADIELILSNDYASHRLGAILTYVKILTLNPSDLTQIDYQAVIEQGFTELELHDAVLVAAAFNMFNRIVEGHRVEANADTWEISSDRIAIHGYGA